MINGIVVGETVACPPPVLPRDSCFNLSEVEKKELEGVGYLLEDFVLFCHTITPCHYSVTYFIVCYCIVGHIPQRTCPVYKYGSFMFLVAYAGWHCPLL